MNVFYFRPDCNCFYENKEIYMKKILMSLMALVFVAGMSACAPEVGSEKWCAQLKEKPKGDWSANEAADYAKHCIFD